MKSEWKDKLKDGANWFTVVFCAILYIAMGIMSIEKGAIVLNDFSSFTWLDWLMWAVFTFVPAVLAVVVGTTFKREGIKDAEKDIAAVVTAYEKLLYVDTKKKVRGKKEYLAKGALKDSASKFVIALVLSFVTGQLLVNLSADGVIKIVINLSMWAYFGFSAYGKSNEYGRTELKEWYIIETAKLQAEKDRLEDVRKKEIEEAKLEVKKQASLIMEQKDAAYNKLETKYKTSIIVEPKTLLNFHSVLNELYETAKKDKDGLAQLGIVPITKLLTDIEVLIPKPVTGIKVDSKDPKGEEDVSSKIPKL